MPKGRSRKSAKKNAGGQSWGKTPILPSARQDRNLAPQKPTRRRWLKWALAGAGVTAAGAGALLLANNMLSHVAEYTYEIINEYDHDPAAFTQGLVYHNGFLYEGTGGRPDEGTGRSSLRKVRLETGEVLQPYVELDPSLFGEGIALWEDKIVQLTWETGIGFVYDRETFRRIGEFQYQGEGWGLTHDGRRLIMSDGTDQLRFLDPESPSQEIGPRLDIHQGERERSFPFLFRRQALPRINELEFIENEIYANVWGSENIYRISPTSGYVTSVLNLRGLRPRSTFGDDNAVLNGIAWDAENRRLFVTGKRWPVLYEIRQIPV